MARQKFICTICGETFFSEHYQAKYCSDECRKLSVNFRYAERKNRKVKHRKLTPIERLLHRYRELKAKELF